MPKTSLFSKEYKLFIGGKWVDGASEKTLKVDNPATGEILAEVPAGNEKDIDRAVEAAWKAFPKWKQIGPAERARILKEIGYRLEKRADDFATMITLENGKTINESRNVEVPLSADHFDYFGGLCRALQGETIPIGENFLDYTLREPWGVVGQIVPWNYPLLMVAWKLAPALAAGNCIVLKPAEQAPLTALEFAKEIQDLLPPGVLNVVTGDGPSAGAPLARHPKVRKVAFTGGVDTGKLIMQYVSENITPVSLELGGKSPLIIFPDADLEKAVETARFGIFFNQGEECTAASRLFVHEKIHEQFMERLIEQTKAIKIGNPLNKEIELGPLITQEHLQRVLNYIEIGRREGAKLLTGGKRPKLDDRALRKGYFLEPTIFDQVRNKMRIAQEEIFGPVLSVISWRDYDKMIEEANGVIYGLGAGIWTKDLQLALKTAKLLEAGMVWINHYGDSPAGPPFGGYKQSGSGRETAMQTLYAYTQTKNINIKLSD